MAITGYMFDGTTLGQATLAPYSYPAFRDYWKALFGDVGFVVPEYGDELEVTPSASNGNVTVGSGLAHVYGYQYENTADLDLSFDIATNNRIDIVVLRVDEVNQTVRATVVKGTHAANPSFPALTGGDLMLAWVYFASGWNPAASPIAASDIHDLRFFWNTSYLKDVTDRKNLLHNCNFYGCSGIPAGANPPDGWTTAGVGALAGASQIAPFASTFAGFGHYSQYYGSGIDFTAASTVGIQTTILTPYGTDERYRTYTVAFSIKNVAGSARILVYGKNTITAGSAALADRYYRITGTATTMLFRVQIDRALYDALNIQILSNAAGANVQICNVQIYEGYGPYRHTPQPEIVFTDYDITDAAWASTAKSTSTTNISLNASFSGNAYRFGIRGIIARLRARDSGSAAGGPYYLQLENFLTNDYNVRGGRADPTGLTNDTWRERIAYGVVRWGQATIPLTARVVASGAGTLDGTITIQGFIT